MSEEMKQETMEDYSKELEASFKKIGEEILFPGQLYP